MYKLLKQIFKFGIVGILAFFIDYLLLVLLTEYFNLYYLLSSMISFSVAVIFNYVCSMTFVFERKEDISRKKELLIFVLLSVTGLLINQFIMWFGSDSLGISYKIIKIFATGIVMVWNFVTRKFFLENKGE